MSLIAALLVLLLSAPAHAQQFPKLSGRVVDDANLLSPSDEAALTQRLEALEQASSRQLVVATVPSLQDYPVEEFGYRLLRAWGIGQKEADNGVILLIAPNERKVRIEVGYGLEPILTDALSSLIIQNRILPKFKAGDVPGGIIAGADAIIEQLQAPPELAEQRALEAARARQQSQAQVSGGGGSIFPLLFWGFVIFFVIMPMLGGRRQGRRYRRGGFPIILWGPGFGGGGSFGGGGFGGGFGGGGGGFGGGFSGGGGSAGGGGASGGW